MFIFITFYLHLYFSLYKSTNKNDGQKTVRERTQFTIKCWLVFSPQIPPPLAAKTHSLHTQTTNFSIELINLKKIFEFSASDSLIFV